MTDYNCPLCGKEVDYTLSGNTITVKCLNPNCRIQRRTKYLKMTKEHAIQVALGFWKS